MIGMNRETGLWVISAVLFVAALARANSASTQNADSEKAKQVTFTGKVIDAEGRPLAGATVTFHQMTTGKIASTYDVELLKEATTKADGAFSFGVAESTVYRQGVIIAQKEGLAIGWAYWRMHADQHHDIALGQPKQLTGVVIDESDNPLADATVFIAAGTTGDKQHLPGPVSRQLLRTSTDAAGRFTFAGLPADATFEFGLEKTAYATMTSTDEYRAMGDALQFAPGQGDIRLVMPVEAKIEGTVVEKGSGRPVAGVAIMVEGSRMRGYFQPEPAVSDAEGTFRIDSLLPDTHTVSLATMPEGLADWVAQPVNVTLKAGQTQTDVLIEVSKGGLLEVCVTEAGTNKPLNKASVSIRDEKNNRWLSAKSDEDGIARIRLMPGGYQLSGVYRQGYESDRRQETVTVEDGATQRVARTLSGMPKIRGIVRDPAGEPLEGVELSILPGGGEEVRSDSQGEFELFWDRSFWGERETTFCLVARHEQRDLAAAREIGEGTEALELKLEPGVTFAGKVVDPNGEGIAGARINPMLRLSSWGSSLIRHQTKQTDGDGNFKITAIPPGHNYNVYVNAEGYGQESVDAHTDNAVNNLLDFETITLPLANLSVSGQIVDIKGNPVPNARIAGSGYGDGQPSRVSTQADGQGHFTLEGVCAGTINIRVDADRDGKRLSAHAVASGGATGLKIVAREGRSVVQYIRAKSYEQVIQSSEKVIAGVALDENGSPVAGVPVGVCCHKKMREDGKFTWTFSSYTTLRDTTDPQGRFAIELEEDGEYNLRFSPDNHAAIIAYDVPVGKKDLKVTLPDGGTVAGRLVRLERGKKVPIPDVEVKLEQTDRASYTHLGFDRDRTTLTDSQGRFRFEHVRTKIRPHGSMSREQWDYIPRVWQISYGDTSKTVGFYDQTRIEEFELVVGPDPEDAALRVGRPLPGFDGIKIDLAANRTKEKMILVCFFDMNQRPSRNCIQQLSKRAQELKAKDIVVVAVQASKVDENALNEWIKKNNSPFPVGMIEGDVEKTLFNWGVKSLPWLILTDQKHVVRSEGFAFSELDNKL